MQESSFSVQWVISISLVDRKYKHIWSYVFQGDFLCNKNAKYIFGRIYSSFLLTNQPFTGLYKLESSLVSQEGTTHLKEGKTVSAHFQLCYVPYHLLPAAIQHLYNKSGKRSLSVILCTFYPLNIIVILLKSNCQNMGPESCPNWLPGRWLLNLEAFCEQKTWYCSAPEWNYRCVMPMVDMIQNRTKEPETSYVYNLLVLKQAHTHIEGKCMQSNLKGQTHT